MQAVMVEGRGTHGDAATGDRGCSAKRIRSLGALLALFGLLACAPTARADEAVTFASASGLAIRGYLTKPAGRGPFPAVVLLHSCLGLPANRPAIGAEVAQWGYVALFVDDFGPRGLKETCSVDFPDGPPDAYGALAFLAGRADVDPARIAAVGFSQGADTALSIAAAGTARTTGPMFKAAAAFYPPCANQLGARMGIPTLILVGALDAVTPAADCRRLANNQPGDIELVVLPGAAHGFDLPEFSGGRPVRGMTLKYDSESAKRAWTLLRRFLAKELER